MTSKKYTPVTVPAYRLYRHTQHAHACLDAHTHAHTHTHTLHTVTSVRVHLLRCITLAIFLPFLGNDQALRHSHPARLVSPPSCLSVCVYMSLYVHTYICMHVCVRGMNHCISVMRSTVSLWVLRQYRRQ